MSSAFVLLCLCVFCTFVLYTCSVVLYFIHVLFIVVELLRFRLGTSQLTFFH